MQDRSPRIFSREAVNGSVFNALTAVVGAFAMGEVILGDSVGNPIAKTLIEAPLALYFYRSYERSDERNRQSDSVQ